MDRECKRVEGKEKNKREVSAQHVNNSTSLNTEEKIH